ncbi:hypothetical protein VYU27_002428 [Nannochloropsis oceanica]
MLLLLVRRALPRLYPGSAGTARAVSTCKPLPKHQQQHSKKKLPPFFSDPATYPLIAIVGSAVTMATGFLVYKSVKSPDVRLRKIERARVSRKLQRSNQVPGFDMPFEKA